MAFKILKMYRVGVGGLTGIGLEDDFLADLRTEWDSKISQALVQGYLYM